MNKITIMTCVACLFLIGCSDNAPKATKDYTVINSQIGFGDFNGIVSLQPDGMKLQEFLTNVGVHNAPYDIYYSVNPYVVPRVYHLGKVRLDLQIERLQDGYYISADYPPSATYDGMTRKDRMNEYYDHMGDLLKERNEALKKVHDKYIK